MPERRCPRCGLYIEPLREDCPYCSGRPRARRVLEQPTDDASLRRSVAKNARLALLLAVVLSGAYLLIRSQTPGESASAPGEPPTTAVPTAAPAGESTPASPEVSESQPSRRQAYEAP